MNCPNCQGPTIQLFTSVVCKNECDIIKSKSPDNKLNELINKLKIYTKICYETPSNRLKELIPLRPNLENFLDELTCDQEVDIISQMCFGENYHPDHAKVFKNMVGISRPTGSFIE